MPSAFSSSPTLFLADGSLDGFLCAIAAALEVCPDPDATGCRVTVAGDAAAAPGLFETPLRVAADPGRANAFLDRLRDRASMLVARRLVLLWSAEIPALAEVARAYAALAFRHGPRVDQFHAHPAVHQALLASRRVTGEIHRLTGLLRFRSLADGSLYGPVAPDANTVVCLAGHFQARLPNERWLIHDTRRGLAVWWDGRRLDTGELAAGAVPPVTAAEAAVQEWWRDYFAAVAIPERRNPALQRRCMPRRYWRWLVESPGGEPDLACMGDDRFVG